jgi:hypothetical protein
MKDIEEELAAIGFGRNRRDPADWHAERLDGGAFSARRPEERAKPACSRALMRWRELLARNPAASPYRIFRAER